jgi:hypothetical protein
METGVKLNLTKTIRSPKTGRLLPKEGTLVSVTENLGRTLLLVEFAGGQHEYLFGPRSNSRVTMHAKRGMVAAPNCTFEGAF